MEYNMNNIENIPYNVLSVSGTYDIIVDPGHGGTDRKNIGKNGYVEADGVLSISKSFDNRMSMYENVKVTLTRYDDKYVSLTVRGLMAKGKYMFISHHTNADSTCLVRGVEVFYSIDLPDDKILAEKIAMAISIRFNIPNRGAKLRESTKYPGEDFYTVIDTAQDNGCQHVFLVEFMFHNNIEDEKILLDNKNLIEIGVIEADVIAKHIGLILKNKSITKYEQEKLDARRLAIKEGITDGTRPSDPMTREEYWVMRYRDSNRS